MVTAESAGARILVIDDDAPLLAFTCKYLSRLGYRVVPYRSAEEAWNHFQAVAAQYSLVVIDLSMPEISGEHLARMMLGSDPEVRLILTSGYPFDAQRTLEAESDRIAFLHKPFTPAMLTEIVNRLIRTSPKRDAD